MTIPPWHEEPISRAHDRDAFDCGDAALNTFLRRHARKSHERGGAKTFLAINDGGGKTILGFYSVAPASSEALRAMKCRCSGLRGWPSIARFRDAASEDSFFLQQVAGASW